MSLFASRENSPAEQRAIETLIVETFDATELKPSSGKTGMARARELAAQAEALTEQRRIWS